MTLGDLIISGVLTSEEKIRVMKPTITGLYTRTGYWFNDDILELRNIEIAEFAWSKKKGWNILLENE